MPYNTRTRRYPRYDRSIGRYRSNNYRLRFVQDQHDYPNAPTILCEGDSWFGYPTKDLSEYIQEFGAFNMFHLEKAGDELIKDMLADAQFERLQRTVADWNFDLILFSGGGNDIVGDNLIHYLRSHGNPNNPDSYITARFNGANGMLKRLERGFRDVLAIANCPVVAHGYDYPRPTGVPFEFFGITLGPWLKPTFDDLNIPPQGELRFRILKSLLDQFNAMMDGLARAEPAFHHVNLLGTLSGARSFWDNEIHPKPRGFRKLAPLYQPTLQALVPGGFVQNGNWRALSRRHRGA